LAPDKFLRFGSQSSFSGISNPVFSHTFYTFLKSLAPKYGLHVSDKDLEVYSIITGIFKDVKLGILSRDAAQEKYRRVLYDMDASPESGAGLFAAKIKRYLNQRAIVWNDVMGYVKLILINDPEMSFIIYSMVVTSAGRVHSSLYLAKDLGDRLLREIEIKLRRDNCPSVYSKFRDDILAKSFSIEILKVLMGGAVIEMCNKIDVLVLGRTYPDTYPDNLNELEESAETLVVLKEA
jgi:hypothetical protein